MKKIILIIISFFCCCSATAVFFLIKIPLLRAENAQTLFSVQSVDTMKLSRDQARQALTDQNYDAVINQQMINAISLGATHIAIDTPYDSEFLPVLERWVAAARKYHLLVWFRGNFSSWEGWFNYPKNLNRNDHVILTREFILHNPDLFHDGDIFTACPECENGGPGDPRMNGDLDGHRAFLIHEYETTLEAFKQIHKKVISSYTSMNGDVAKLVMDISTTKALGGVVLIDHYVASSEKFEQDILSLASSSGGKIIIGEFGAPIPDINGDMTENQQADFISKILALAYDHHDIIIGMNYWTETNSSTALYNNNGTERKVAGIMKSYYTAQALTGTVLTDYGEPIAGAMVSVDGTHYSVQTDSAGMYKVFLPDASAKITIQAKNFKPNIFGFNSTNLMASPVALQPVTINFDYRFHRSLYFLKKYFSKLF